MSASIDNIMRVGFSIITTVEEKGKIRDRVLVCPGLVMELNFKPRN